MSFVISYAVLCMNSFSYQVFCAMIYLLIFPQDITRRMFHLLQLLVPRQSYFPLVMDKVQKHFLKHMSTENQEHGEMWLEFEGQPLKW